MWVTSLTPGIVSVILLTRSALWGPPCPTHRRVEEQGEARGCEAQRWAPQHNVQDMPPIQGAVGGARDLGVEEVGEAECVHHDQHLWESRGLGCGPQGGRLC